jgi:hypothetical protein
MSRKNYNRKQHSSFVPNFTGQSETEREESIIARMGKAKYYGAKGKARTADLGDLDPDSGLSLVQMEAVRVHRRKVKL